MPLLGFQKQFAPLVESGEKRQTIRAHRKRPFVKGDRLYLYTGLRTKQCRKLGEAVCTKVESIRIRTGGAVLLGSQLLGVRQIQRISRDDGFDNAEEMVQWFEETHGLPFEGQLIRWGRIER